MYRCRECRTYFPWPLPTQEQTLSIYSEGYFKGASGGAGYVDYDRDKLPMVAAFERYLDLIEQHLPERGTLNDIGAATGFFLKLARSRGWKVMGVEPSEHASSQARRDGLDVRTGVFHKGLLPGSSLDVITMWDVLEHVPEPKALIEAAHDTLRAGGLLVINTPDSESLLARVLRTKWHLVIPPEHLFLLNRNALQRLLGPQFDILRVGRIGKRFTLQYVLEILFHWQKLAFWNLLHRAVKGRKLGLVNLPINLRDNIFVMARKR